MQKWGWMAGNDLGSISGHNCRLADNKYTKHNGTAEFINAIIATISWINTAIKLYYPLYPYLLNTITLSLPIYLLNSYLDMAT